MLGFSILQTAIAQTMTNYWLGSFFVAVVNIKIMVFWAMPSTADR